MKGWVLVVGAVLLAVTVVVALAGITALVEGCGSTPAPSPRVVDCGAQYGECVAKSADVEAYRVCRARVDAVCFAEGGAP